MASVRFSTPSFREFNDLFGDFFNTTPIQKFTPSIKSPKVNIEEKEDKYLLEMLAPGLEKADFKINLDKDLLTISYEQKKASEEKETNGKLIRKEFEFRSFSRSFSLDDKIDSAAITAVYENGVLKLSLPKKLEAAKEVKQIAIQ